MKKKKISLVQVNFQQGPEDLKAYYLPYSIGCIWSYAYSFTEIQQTYQLDHVLWRREHIEDAAQKLASQDIVVFSCYIWNRHYNYALASKIKNINPQCKIIFGGPELPITDSQIFQKLPFIDVVIKKEGEITFKELLSNIDHIRQIPGLVINLSGQSLDTGDAARINDLSVLPSPYLSGFFDSLIQDNPDIEWMATLETNRGCPYQCTFCDWGSLTLSKIKVFPLEKVFGEIEWMSRNRCGVMYVADANFGIFPERDNLIVDKFIAARKQHGMPYNWGASWAKNQRKEVIEIIKKLSSESKFYSLGLNISLQSLTDKVLTNIKRKNMHEVTAKDMFALAEKMQQPTFSELILGLPGETLASWKENFFSLFRMNVHCFVDVSVAQVLENAEMNLVQKQIYDIETKEVYDYLSGTFNNDQWPETIAVVKSTRDLSEEDMISAMVFTWFITTFHMHNFSNFVSRFLYKHHSIDFNVFYDRLFDILLEDPWFGEQKKLVDQGVRAWFADGRVAYPDLANGIKIHSWNIFNATAMRIHHEDRYQTVFRLVEKTLEYFESDIELRQDVMRYQRMEVIQLNALDSYPRPIKFQHNVYDYVINGADLQKQEHQLLFDFRYEKKPITKEYIERIFYSRKNNFTKSVVSQL